MTSSPRGPRDGSSEGGPSTKPGPRAPTILLIDDSPSTRRALATIVIGAGFRVIEAATGREGLARMAACPDLVLLDVELPDVRGPEVCRTIKTNPLMAHIPVLEISAARILPSDQVHGLDEGADAYLTLPVDPGVLIATIRCLLRMHAALDRLDRLHALAAALAGAATTSEVAQVALEHALQATSADGGAVALLDPDKAALEITAETGALREWLAAGISGDPVPRRIPIQRPFPLTICAWTGEPIWIESGEAYIASYPHLARAARATQVPRPEENGTVLLLRERSIQALAAVPLLIDGRAVGALALVFSAPRVFPDAERAFLTTVAQHAAQALERARLLQAERQARERAEHAIELERRSARAREDLLAVVSHDLRNPLHLVAMGGQMIQHQAPEGEEGDLIRRHAERILRAAERMNGLIRDLLDAASIEAGAFQVDVAAQPMPALIADAIDAVAPLARAKSIEITRDVDDVVVECDRDRVLQALVNLLANAVKFTPELGEIRVSCAMGEDSVVLSVADTGPGVPLDQIPTMFDRYVRQSRTTGGGTGLGLYIAKAIAEAHGGTIWVDSSPGQGATFSFSLPRAWPTR